MKRTRAFTLIELLVVVAIIGLLIAILVPALSAAFYNSKKSTCAANLKGLGQAAISYATEWDDELPQHQGGGYWLWDVPSPTVDALLDTAVSTSGLPPTSVRRWFYCPDNISQNTQINGGSGANNDLWTEAAGVSGTTDTGFRIIGYTWMVLRPGSSLQNGGAVDGWTSSTQFDTSQMPQPARTGPQIGLHDKWSTVDNPSINELMFDGTVSRYSATNPPTVDWSANGSSNITHHASHMNGTNPGGANNLCFDGHVEWRAFNMNGAYRIPFNTDVYFWILNPTNK